MSDFSDKWGSCMKSKGLPVPNVEGINEALELIDKVHSAWEKCGRG